MSHPAAVVLVWLGALGVGEFGGLWLAVSLLDSEAVGRHARALVITCTRRSRRRRIEHWIQFVPSLTVVSAVLIATGAITLWATAS